MLNIALCSGFFFVVDAVGVCWVEVVCCITVFFYYVILHLEEEVSTSDVLIDMDLCVLNIVEFWIRVSR